MKNSFLMKQHCVHTLSVVCAHMLQSIMFCSIKMSFDVMVSYVMSCHFMSCHVMSCHVMSSFVKEEQRGEELKVKQSIV